MEKEEHWEQWEQQIMGTRKTVTQELCKRGTNTTKDPGNVRKRGSKEQCNKRILKTVGM